MKRPIRFVSALAACTAALFLGAAKPAPTPAPFVAALAYKYGPQEIRLSNADGTQAVLLVRKPRGDSVLWLSLAPIGQQRAAFIEATNSGTVRSLRIVAWNQEATGTSVVIDAQPLVASQNTGMALADLDFSPDGSKLAVLLTDYNASSELRFFDVASRQQLGNAVPLTRQAMSLSWRAYDNSILLRAPTGLSAYKDGVETPLFDEPDQGGEFDAFNGTAADVILPYKDYPVQGNLIQRWDGSSVSDGTAVLSMITTNGVWPNMSCDNSRMVYTELAAKRTAYNLVLATGAKVLFSKDSNVQRMTYPNACG